MEQRPSHFTIDFSIQFVGVNAIMPYEFKQYKVKLSWHKNVIELLNKKKKLVNWLLLVYFYNNLKKKIFEAIYIHCDHSPGCPRELVRIARD